ncbi:hypothetical protein N7488_001774 [Penicillium malachiteum]|nr:hypothetical protein N7488_001774 [Penicillium malachiteum]
MSDQNPRKRSLGDVSSFQTSDSSKRSRYSDVELNSHLERFSLASAYSDPFIPDLNTPQISSGSIQGALSDGEQQKFVSRHIEDDLCFGMLNIIISEHYCQLQSKYDEPVAVMNKKAQHALFSVLSSAKSIKYRGFISQEDLIAPIAPAAKFLMRIDVLGARADKKTIGQELSKYRFFLQHPSPILSDGIYENPHFLNTGGEGGFANGTLLPPLLPHNLDQPKPSRQLDTPATVEKEATDFFSLIDGLSQPIYEKIPTDQRIRASLLRKCYSHQSDGVSFVIHRETAADNKSGSLWITGKEDRTAPDTFGGILADDMGLGKTLTMIASIAYSISQAEMFARATSELNTTGIMAIKSTLVIVPNYLILEGWCAEIEKCISTSSAPPYDIVLTTYETLGFEFGEGGGALGCFQWYRIILDEGMFISRNT